MLLGALKLSCVQPFAFNNTTYMPVKYTSLRNMAAAKDWSDELYNALCTCLMSSESGRCQSNCGVDENTENIMALVKEFVLSGQYMMRG